MPVASALLIVVLSTEVEGDTLAPIVVEFVAVRLKTAIAHQVVETVVMLETAAMVTTVARNPMTVITISE